MRVLLVRHGQAAPASRDPERPLTETGRTELERLAPLIAAARGWRPSEVWHSPKRRARETAEILARLVCPRACVTEINGLLPGDPPESLAELLFAERQTVMIVSHLPLLGELASLLVCGNANADAFVFTPATALALERIAGARRFVARFMVYPELVPADRA